MRIIYRYILSEILKYALLVLVTVVAIYLVVDFLEKIDNVIEAGQPATLTLVYEMYKIPFILARIAPLAVLLSVLITFGMMAKNNEITALRSCGISVYALLKPVLAVGLGASVLLFIFSETAVPISAAEANRIWTEKVRKRSLVVSREKNIWIKENRRINHIRYYNKTERAIFGVTLCWFDEAFHLARRVDAARGLFYGSGSGPVDASGSGTGEWRLFNLMEQNLNPETGEYDIRFADSERFSLGFSPDSLETVVKTAGEMSFSELRDYVRRVEGEGYDATRYRVDLHAKVAFPFVCLILAIVALGITARGKLRGGVAVGIAYGIGVAFAYWVFHSFCISLGYGDILAPAAAAWSANALFLCFGVFNLLNVD